MHMNNAERDARAALFARIEAEVLPAAEKRVEAISPLEVGEIRFGARPTAKAFGADGDLRFELGRWDADRFVPFGDRIMLPFVPPKIDVAYPKETSYLWSNALRHYTPVTRRLDYVEIWDYFSVKRARDEDVREKALGLLASRLAKNHSPERVKTTCRYIRYAEQYVVVTGIESREFAAAGEDERRALLDCINGKPGLSPQNAKVT